MGLVAARCYAACGIVLALVLVITAGVAQSGDDPRNASDAYYDAVNGARCADHHAAEGFRPFGVRFTEQYTQVPIGEEIEIEVRIRHTSQMTTLHRVEDVVVVLNISEAPNVRVVTPETPGDVALQDTLTLRHRTPQETVFPVYPGAVAGHVSVRLLETSPGVDDGEWTAHVAGQALVGRARHRSLELEPALLASHGPGDWPVVIEWESPVGDVERRSPVPLPVTASFAVDIWVNHSAAATEYTFKPPEGSYLRLRTDDPILIQVPIVLTGPGRALLDFRIEGWTIFDHPATALRQNAVDDGLYHRFITMQIEDGDEVRLAQQTLAPTPLGPSVDIYNLLTRILGFMALLLVLTALVSGGALGKRSRRSLNRATGGARRRVLTHSTTGFLILVVATTHFALALVENRNQVSHGLFWGGVAWFLLVTLGFTGYYQSRMIQRFGYRTWRHVHLWSAVLVLLFVIVHVVIEGSAMSALREHLPAGHERLAWPPAPD